MFVFICALRGSVEATKYAQSLIEALINDSDKKFEQQLPKLKPLTSSNSSHSGQKQKQSVSGGSAKVSAANSNGVYNVVMPSSKEDQKNVSGKLPSSVSLPSAWAQPSAAILQPKMKASAAVTNSDITITSAWIAGNASRSQPEASRMSYSDRAKAAVALTVADQSGSWSPPVEAMSACNVESSPVSSTTVMRPEPVPLPIVVPSVAALPVAPVSRPAAVATTIVRDYSPFNNMLSQLTGSVLAKRPADDFASIAAAGVVSSSQLMSPDTFTADSSVYHQSIVTSSSDPELMAKAPGYRPMAGADPAKAPGHRVSKDSSSFGTRGCSTTSAAVNDSNFQSHDFGRPNSTPTAAMSLINDSNLVGRALAASLDRPQSLYGGGNIYGPGPGLGYTQHSHLPPFAQGSHSLDAFVSSVQHGVDGVSGQQPFGTPCSLGSSVNETSVLAAPLMTASIAPGSVVSHDHNTFDNRLGVSASSSASECN